MENQNTSVNVPLLENPPSRTQPTYLKTGFFDTFLMFWVGKIVDVIESYFIILLFTSRLETAKHSNKICIGTFVNKSPLASWPRILLKNLTKTNIKKIHYFELLHPLLKVMNCLAYIISHSILRNLLPCYALFHNLRSSSI